MCVGMCVCERMLSCLWSERKGDWKSSGVKDWKVSIQVQEEKEISAKQKEKLCRGFHVAVHCGYMSRSISGTGMNS